MFTLAAFGAFVVLLAVVAPIGIGRGGAVVFGLGGLLFAWRFAAIGRAAWRASHRSRGALHLDLDGLYDERQDLRISWTGIVEATLGPGCVWVVTRREGEAGEPAPDVAKARRRRRIRIPVEDLDFPAAAAAAIVGMVTRANPKPATDDEEG